MAGTSDDTTLIETGTAVDDTQLPLVLPASVARTTGDGLPTKETIDWEELTRNWYVSAANKLQESLFDVVSQTNDNFAEVKRTITAVTDETHSIASDVEDLTATVGQNKATAHDELLAYVGPDGSVSQQITQLNADFDANSAAITREATARADADSATAQVVADLTSTVGANAAAAHQELMTYVGPNGSISQEITQLSATTDGNTAAIGQETTARTNADSAIAKTVADLNTQVGQNSATAHNELLAYVGPNGTVSQSLQTLTTAVNGNTSSLQTLGQSLNGVEVKYGVQGYINGQTGGFVFTGVLQNDGSVAYNMEFDSNVTINGNLVVSGTINNLQLGNYSASQVGIAGTANNAPCSITYTSRGSGSLVVNVGYTGGLMSGSGSGLQITLTVDGAVMGTWPIAVVGSGDDSSASTLLLPATGLFAFASPAAGARTVQAVVTGSVGSSAVNVGNLTMVVTENSK